MGYKAESLHKNNFNFLRLLGACLVIFSHCYDVTGKSEDEPVNHLLQGKLEASGIGLCIFFFISGYFVFKSASESEGIIFFVKKRIFRIYPALIILVFLTVFVIGPLFSQLNIFNYFNENDTWKYFYTVSGIRIRFALPGVFTNPGFFTPGVNASLWTISWEIILYFFLALLIPLNFFKAKKVLLFLALVISVACFATAIFYHGLNFFYNKYLNITGIFFLGSFIYAASCSKKQITILFCVSLLFFLVTTVLRIPFIKNEIALFISICTATYLVGFSKKLKLWLIHDISYGLYIIAFPIQQIIFKLTNYNSSIFVQLTCTFLVSMPIAYLSWKFIEHPFIQLAHQKSKKLH